MQIHVSPVPASQHPFAELDRLGDEIAELSAHLDAATARLLDLIREFDARGGWNTGFRSCAAWLSWRVGLDLGAARERVRVARALGTLPLAGPGPGPRGAVVRQGPRPDPRGHAGDRGAAAGGGAGGHGRPRRADRAGLAAGGPAGRGAGGRAAAREPGAPGVSGRGRHGGVRGRLEPEVGALLLQALAAARETLYQRARVRGRRTPGPADVSAETPDHGPAAGRRAGAARGDGPPPRARSRRPGRALPGGGPRRRPGAGGPGAARPVGPRGRRARFRGNVPAPGVRREPGGDAPRRGRARRGGRGPDPDDSPGAAAGAPPPGPGLPLPGLRASASARGITSATGPTAARPRSRTSRCSVAGTTAPSTRRATRSSDEPDGALRFRRPDGRPLPEVPPPPRCPPIPSRRSGRGTTRRAFASHARTACPGWLGERLDVGWAIDVLHPLAQVRTAPTSLDHSGFGR